MMRPLRILIVTHLYPVAPGDYKGVHVHEMAAGLAARGHAVSVLTLRRRGSAPRESRDGVAIERFRYWGWWRGWQLGQLAGYPPLTLGSVFCFGILRTLTSVRRFRPDLIHAYWVVPGGFMAAVAGRLSGRPVVATAAGTDLNMASQRRLVRAFVRVALAGTARLICAGTGMREIAIGLGYPADRARVLPNYIGLESEAEPGAEAALPLAGEAGARLVYVGNLEPPKRVDLILKALARVREQAPGAALTIVGEGPLRPELERLAAELGLGAAVHFLGRRPHGEIMALLRAGDLFVHASDHEGLPVAICEAMLAGLPVVATRVGGVPDLVEEGRTGLLAPPGDDAAFAAALARLLADPAECARMRTEALRFAAERLDRDAIIARLESIYREALGRREG